LELLGLPPPPEWHDKGIVMGIVVRCIDVHQRTAGLDPACNNVGSGMQRRKGLGGRFRLRISGRAPVRPGLAPAAAMAHQGAMSEPPRITAIYRYPVKGLSPERLGRVELAPGQTLPADRRFAIENGPSGFDPAAPAYFPKQRFLMLMRNERLASLATRFDETTHTLVIAHGGREVARGDLATDAGRAAIEGFFTAFCAADLRGPPKILEAPGHSFSDVARKVVSIINLASVAELEQAIGARVDPLRFRANLYVAGWPAWREFELLDQALTVGESARVRVVKRIVRCAATNVDPRTGARDLAIPETLLRQFGHADCGIYAEVIAGGTIAIGDSVDRPAKAPNT
jgi:uncharacterized protein YcbX